MQHLAQVMSAEPHTADHIRLEDPAPLIVGDVEKFLRRVDTKIVDEDINGWELLNYRRGTIGCPCTSQQRLHTAKIRHSRCGQVQAIFAPPRDRYDGALAGEPLCHREPDTLGRCRDEDAFAIKPKIYSHMLCISSNVRYRDQGRNSTRPSGCPFATWS